MFKNRYFLIGLGFGFILCGILLIISSSDFILSNSTSEEFTIEELKEIALEKNLHLYTEEELNEIKDMIENHVKHTGSPQGKKILNDWKSYSLRFTKIIPKDYKRMLENIDKAHKAGISGEEALMVAFEENYKN